MSEIRKQDPQEPPQRDEQCPDDLTMAAYLDGGLSPEETVLVEKHISHCADCSLTVHALREAFSAPPEPLPAESLAKLQAFVLTAVAQEWAAHPRVQSVQRPAARICSIETTNASPPARRARRVPLAVAACFVLCIALPALGYVTWKCMYSLPAPTKETANAPLAPEKDTVKPSVPPSSGMKAESNTTNQPPLLPLRDLTSDRELRKEIEAIAVNAEVQALLPRTEAEMEAWARKEYPHTLWLYDVLTKPEYGINWNGVPANIPAWAEQFYPDAATRPRGWRALVIYSGDAFRFDLPQTAAQPNVLPRLQSLQLAAAVAGYDTALVSADGQELPALAWADAAADAASQLRLTPHAAATESSVAKSLVPTPANIPEAYPKQLVSVPAQSVSVLQYTWASSTLLAVSSGEESRFNGLATKCHDGLIAVLLYKNTSGLSYLTDRVTDTLLDILEQRKNMIQKVQNEK